MEYANGSEIYMILLWKSVERRESRRRTRGADRGPPGIGVGLAGPKGHPLRVTFLAWVSNLFLSPKIIFL
jgi:hypothetical protein